ncbi:hypothetical protein AVEN_267339-1 [Araneus ventricosus]|uniref:Uncharacterized protein n=1 Tax=Araneus ventricosus TaxID=182803 RepID=A0A4Y2DM93_ARAVE|nr:hypothetical protein AVEN_267339-1 [Araneus ventricosus]
MEFDSHYSKCEHKPLRFNIVPINRLDIQSYSFNWQKDMERILDGHLLRHFTGTNSIKSRGKHPEGRNGLQEPAGEKTHLLTVPYSNSKLTQRNTLPVKMPKPNNAKNLREPRCRGNSPIEKFEFKN